MHSKFPAAQWIEYCTANTVRIRIDILYQWTCRFAFFFSITFLQNFAAIPILYQPKKQFGASLYTPLLALLHSSRFSSTYWQVFNFTNANLESKHSVFHIIFVHLFPAVRTPLVIYNLQIFSPCMASSRRGSVGRALYRECGPSQDGNLPF